MFQLPEGLSALRSRRVRRPLQPGRVSITGGPLSPPFHSGNLGEVRPRDQVSITGGPLSPPFCVARSEDADVDTFQLPEGLSALRPPLQDDDRDVGGVSITGGPLSPPFKAHARGSDAANRFNYRRASQPSVRLMSEHHEHGSPSFNYRRASQPSVTGVRAAGELRGMVVSITGGPLSPPFYPALVGAVLVSLRVSITGGPLSPPFSRMLWMTSVGAAFQLPEGLSALRSRVGARSRFAETYMFQLPEGLSALRSS